MNKCIGWGLSRCHNDKAEGNILYCSTCEGNRKAHERRLLEDGIEEGGFENEDEITCPYCGHKEHDNGGPDNDENYECVDCGKRFRMERVVTVTYNTYKHEYDYDESEADGG